MIDLIVDFLGKYTPVRQEPRLLLPIVALVILWFETRNLIFLLPKKLKQISPPSQQEMLAICSGLRSRGILVVVLSIYLAWGLYFQLVLLTF
jgi:hypothetical protein